MRPIGSSLRSLRLTVFTGLLFIFAFGLTPPVQAQGAPHANRILSWSQTPGTVLLHLASGILRVQPCAANIAHITFAHAVPIPKTEDPAVLASACVPTAFRVIKTSKTVAIETDGLQVLVDRYSGAVSFADVNGSRLLSESSWPYPRQLKPDDTDGLTAHRASAWFALTPGEHIYGLGQHQDGRLNQRGLDYELSQDNTNISVPFFLSSKGYGLFWNNASVTRWDNRFAPVLNISSSVANTIDYYFIAGPSFDRILAGYRRLTGQAALLPRWAYGFWQSKLAYHSQSQLLGIAAKYRALHIPLDNIVLDMGWETRLGSRVFNSNFPDPAGMVKTLHGEHVHLMVSVWPIFQPGSANFKAMQQHGYFVTGGVNRIPAYYPGSQLYDAFNPRARALYWQQIRRSLFDLGVDAFWMDSSEPSDMFEEEHGPMLAGAHTALGNGSRYANLYPLMTTTAVYQGQRSISDKRVFLLSRSAFAGMQRNGAAAWSGDIATDFATLRREIPAGLNYSMTGLPYWTTDIGGFLGGDTADPAYREVYVRWFQYGSFCPIFRTHGARKNNENELWSFGGKDQSILTLYDRLRYRLMPYTYALAGRTTLEGYTPMRALAFDFRRDKHALDTGDEFMYGPSILVAPVTHAGAVNRRVYLPQNPGAVTDWYDFWTGARLHGNQTITRATPLKTMPLYVRAGSILPMGPEEQYTGEFHDAPIELRVYPGANGQIRLYEDDGLTYDYEHGQYAQIPIVWNNAKDTLTIGPTRGTYPGMAPQRVFHLVLVRPAHGTGEAVAPADATIHYAGNRVQVHLAVSGPSASNPPAPDESGPQS
jgi:alpha-D-xyloside xylohydrolase